MTRNEWCAYWAACGVYHEEREKGKTHAEARELALREEARKNEKDI